MSEQAPNEPIQTSDGSYTLHSKRYDQTYHSIHGAVTEAEYVFLEGSGVLERLHNPPTEPVRILEIGLGLGVNAMVTAAAAKRFGVNIEYVGIEHDFQPIDVIRRVLDGFEPSSVDNFCSAVHQHQIPEPAANSAINQSKWEPIAAALNSNFSLQIIPFGLNSALSKIPHATHAKLSSNKPFHAIYLDAFSPDTNPECWTPEILNQLGQNLISGGKLATYCAKGSVRRALQAAGLSVTRRPGPPGKRECLAASK